MSTQQKISAEVSKSFFVDMLTRDIGISMAISDLVDNSIDGALRLRGHQRFDGLEVILALSDRELVISDNCGGIDLNTAVNYAFRFGRPADAPEIEHSIGRFGVGMKRAIFKLGNHFSVESTAQRSQFVVDVNVPDWEKRAGWDFVLTSSSVFDEEVEEAKRGTTIRVEDLHSAVATQFSLQLFVENIRRSIASRHQEHLENGLSVSVNGQYIVATPIWFSYSSQLKPAYQELSLDNVDVRLMAGVGESHPRDAGWYVFCNGRLVLGADQSEVTGWGDPGVTRIPKYHNQFARFRGCAFLDSDDPKALPWNTTKDGVDEESTIYQAIRTNMVTVMRPVIDFLNQLDNEQGEPEEARPLTTLVQSAPPVPVAQLPKNAVFSYQTPVPRPPRVRTIRLQYDRPVSLVNRVKGKLGVTSASAAGERTFDYFVEAELEDE